MDKNTANRTILLGVLIFVVTSTAGASIPDELYDSISQCGINALYSCMRYLGIELPLDQLYCDIPRNENNEVNLYQLAEYARNCGLYVKPIKHPTLHLLKKYLTSSSSAIVQFKYPDDKSHIVALLSPDNSDIWVYDVPLEKSIVSDDTLGDLLKRSQGTLILSLTPVEKSIFGRINASRRIWGLLAATSLGVLVATTLSIKRGRKK